MSREIAHGALNESTVIRFLDATTGDPEHGVDHDTAGLALWYRREGETVVEIEAVALASLDAAHVDGGIEHMGNGYYRLDVPDAAWVTGAAGVTIAGAATGMTVIGSYHPLLTAVGGFGAADRTKLLTRPKIVLLIIDGAYIVSAWNL